MTPTPAFDPSYRTIYFRTLAAVLFIAQYTSILVPADVGCSFAEWRHFFDFSLGGRPSMFCIGDLRKRNIVTCQEAMNARDGHS